MKINTAEISDLAAYAANHIMEDGFLKDGSGTRLSAMLRILKDIGLKHDLPNLILDLRRTYMEWRQDGLFERHEARDRMFYQIGFAMAEQVRRDRYVADLAAQGIEVV